MKLFKLLIITLMILSSAAIFASDNLLENSSFETAGSNSSTALGWNYYRDGYSRSSAIVTDGSWSCKLTGSGSSNEDGFGGTYKKITNGLPAGDKFTAISNIYLESYSQGIIKTYISVKYTDSTQSYFTRSLSAAEISGNINTWKAYRLDFETDAAKTIESINYWCLIWKDGTAKFIGTVYFDNLKLKVFKPALYWRSSNIYSAWNRDTVADNVLDRGFTHATVDPFGYNPVTDNDIIFLANKGFDVIFNIRPKSELAYIPRCFSPYNDKNNYDNAVQTLTDMLNDLPISGIVDDIEDLPFPSISYSLTGEADIYTFPDLEERIGNQSSQSPDWPVFKHWPVAGAHNISNLTMENIEYNFPTISIDAGGTPNSLGLIGYYGPGFTYESYEMVAQTFKPSSTRITRIDVMIRRNGSNSSFPLGNIYYYITKVDANGKPDLSKRYYPTGCILNREIDYSASGWNGIDPLSLYFDPTKIEFDLNETYALILEFTKKDSNNWNGAYYSVAHLSNNPYINGEAYKRSYGTWIASSGDFWFKVYKPNPPIGFALNQFHEDWIDFQCAVNARFVEDYRAIADSVTLAVKVWLYSGYANVDYTRKLHNLDGMTRRAYSVNWEMMAAAGLDYAICGYGTRPITSTLNALQAGNPSKPPKLIGGTGLDGNESTFIDRYNNCDGVLLFYFGEWYSSDPGWSVPQP